LIELISPDRIREIWGYDDESDVSDLVASITNTITEYCNTTFEVIEYTDEVLDSSSKLVPAHLPIVAVSSFQETISFDGTDKEYRESVVEDYDYFVYPSNILLEDPYSLRKGIKISYTAGYDSVPESVYQIADELANFRYFKSSEGSLLFYKSQVFEEREYEFDQSMSEAKILYKLHRYKQAAPKKNRTGKFRVGVI